MHPLAEDFSKLKDADIELKIQDLSRKYFMTRNVGVQMQMSALLEQYKEELGNRRRRELEKMMNNRDKGLDKLINIE
jgi:hypothetical protein